MSKIFRLIQCQIVLAVFSVGGASAQGTLHAPVKSDFDGDGCADPAVFHAATANWYVPLSGTHYTTTLSRAWGGGLPVPAYP